ncbi:MAG TPA: isoprenylcysteine carboxylmethyltransferase family protein [Vicinamibacterales bacterium]|nr:isoprenylcysteine carboxylmethyltransferase family protein [Vicinamibacterales bacterium]
MFLVLRATFYAALFIGLVLIKFPGWLASPALEFPASMGWPQRGGVTVMLLGLSLMLWCVAMFVAVGRGTPAPFDPPRRLVARGPYAIVRNPMYLGAVLMVSGAALFYESMALQWYAWCFFGLAHLMVVSYEEPKLRDTFGDSYDAYCSSVGRWVPR